MTGVKGKDVTVTCSLTIDNRIGYIGYKGYAQGANGPVSKGFQSLKATGGDPWDWQQEKKITFKADFDEKGELQIEGEDTNDDDNCTWGGLLLHCTASDVNSPWHNFKSDKGHWRTGDYKQPCSVHGKGMIPVAMPFMKYASKGIYEDLVKQAESNTSRKSISSF